MSDRQEPKLHEAVLGAVVPAARRRFGYAGVLALTVHVGGGAAALAFGGDATAIEPPKSPALVVFEHVVDLEPPPPPPPPPTPVQEPPPRAKPKAEPPVKAPAAAPEVETPPPPPEAPEPAPELPPSEPPPAAQAGQVVAASEHAPAPANFQIAAGAGAQYAGGTTTASGTGTQANHTAQIGVGDGNGLSRARPAQLHTRNWPCGWPPEAEELDIEETYVTIRAAVRADGSVVNVEVVSDPGHGFGRRAVWCARSKVKFDPALDAAGRPVDGNTPPLRVHFVREE